MVRGYLGERAAVVYRLRSAGGLSRSAPVEPLFDVLATGDLLRVEKLYARLCRRERRSAPIWDLLESAAGDGIEATEEAVAIRLGVAAGCRHTLPVAELARLVRRAGREAAAEVVRSFVLANGTFLPGPFLAVMIELHRKYPAEVVRAAARRRDQCRAGGSEHQ